jgi:hypothetical protein
MKKKSRAKRAPVLDPRTQTCIEQLELLIAFAKAGKRRMYIAGVSTGAGDDVTVTVGSYGEPGDPLSRQLYEALSAAFRSR